MTSIVSIYRRFPTKESCLEHLEKVRWKDEPCCPYCKSEKVSKKVEKEFLYYVLDLYYKVLMRNINLKPKSKGGEDE